LIVAATAIYEDECEAMLSTVSSVNRILVDDFEKISIATADSATIEFFRNF
jgi:hypothetical protein